MSGLLRQKLVSLDNTLQPGAASVVFRFLSLSWGNTINVRSAAGDSNVTIVKTIEELESISQELAVDNLVAGRERIARLIEKLKAGEL